MAFGGYKFSGFRVDNSQYADVTNRCLAIHAARVRAFLTASGLAGNPWTADSDRLTGEIDLNISTGVLTSGVNNGVIHILKNINDVTKAYSSYFKYSSGDVTGYYYILTMVDYGIGDSTDSGYIKLNKNTCLQRYGTNYQSSSSYYYYGPKKASCFHCLSLDPFPSSLSPADLDLSDMKATRLCSIGTNGLGNSDNSYLNGGYVNKSNITSLFGYAIKDTDIISFAGSGGTSDYTNPFSTGTGGQVSVLSLNAFSELYNPNDTYKLLQYDAMNCSEYNSNSSNVLDETYVASHAQRGAADQVLDPQSGEPLVDTEAAHTVQVYVLSDARTYYNPSGAQTTPYSGLQLGLYDGAYSGNRRIPFSNSTQYIKGSTNPELLAMNVSYSALSYTPYSPSIDGNLLFVNSAYANGYGAILDPNYYQMTNSNSKLDLSTAYYNFFIGWDSENPDIKSDLAWPEYNATV